MGGSLVVSVPNEVIEYWNLKKGDEVRVSVDEGAIKIEPKQTIRIQTISEEAIAQYSKLMKGIQAKVTMDSEASALHIEFRGENDEAVHTLLRNLWRNLPFLLSMIGLGSVEASPKPRKGRRKGKRHDGANTNKMAKGWLPLP